MAATGDIREEFLSEAQEILEALSRDLLLLDHAQREGGGTDPDLLNSVFRALHTLKGLAGMFAYAQLAALAHSMENLLDDLRLERLELNQSALDVLFDGVEMCQRLLADIREPEGAGPVHAEQVVEAIDRLRGERRGETTAIGGYEIDPSILGVLTEHEEHRLRKNIEMGLLLYRVHVRFSLTELDSALEGLKAKAKPVAEIITFLPSMGGASDDAIELEVILASRLELGALREAIGLEEGSIEQVAQRPTSADEGEGPKSGSMALAAPLSGEMNEVRGATAEALALRSITNSVRVDIRKLDHLMNVVGELAIVRNAVGRVVDRMRKHPETRSAGLELHRLHRTFERHLQGLQDGILDVRMVPLGQVFEKVARVVRNVARDYDRDVRFVVTGSDTEVDKLIVEELSDPLMHLVRNAIDHGIEAPSERERVGKPKVGTVAVNAFQKGNHVLIEVEDDGGGIDEARLVEAALERGIIDEAGAKELTREAALNLLFLPGVTTRASITDVSGRGVGMDVVKTNISRLGGVVDVRSELGIGTKFTVTLPITLAIVRALIVEVAGRSFAMPLAGVREVLSLDPNTVRTIEGREFLDLRGATLPLSRIAQLFEIDASGRERTRKFVVVAALGSRRVGFVVDALVGQHDIVVKALGASVASVRGFAGATDLGDQRVALVLDTPALLEEVIGGSDRGMLVGASA